MRRRKLVPSSLPQAMTLNPLFIALCGYTVVFWFLLMWLFIGGDRSWAEYKLFVLGPMLGSFHLVHVLTFVNVAWFLLLTSQAFVTWKRKARPNWKALGALAASLALVSLMQVVVMKLDATAARIDSDEISSDEVMLVHFEEQRKNLESVVTGIQSGLAESKDYDSFSQWELWSEIGPDRMSGYYTLLKKAGLRREFTGRDKGRQLEFTAAVNAIGTRGSWKGYLYSERPPSPLASSLDGISSKGIELAIYRPIEDNWYLFLRQHH